MKNMKKAGSVSLALCLSLGLVLPGCAPDNGFQINESMTQIYISIYTGGVGIEWLNNAIEGFEEKYANTSFEEGKMGVEVVPAATDKSSTAGNALLAGLSGNTNDVFFTEGIYYYDILAQNGAAEITDMVTSDLSEFGEEGTLEDKMDDALIDFYKTAEGKYYALPFYEGYYGINYNVDYFETENLYFKEDYRSASDLEDMFVSSPTETRSGGPDGEPGTMDDGLPATYEDFYRLCERIVDIGGIPLIWSGMYPYVTSYVNYQMWADYEGRDQFYLNFSFDGVADDLVESISDDGTVTLMPPTQIDNENGVLLQKQRGKYEVLKFMENLLHPRDETDQFYHEYSFSPSLSNTDAQATFLASIVDSSKIAMLLDGNWWEREADSVGAFTGLINYGYNKEDLRFGFMPFPKATDEQVGDPRTVVSINDSICFINSRTTGVRLELSKLFLQYCHTDRMLSEFTKITSMTKPYFYELGEEDEAELTFYGEQIYSLKDPDGNTDIVYPYSDNPLFLNNFASFHPYEWGFSIPEGRATAQVMNDTGMTAREYFLKLYPAYEQKWQTYLSTID